MKRYPVFKYTALHISKEGVVKYIEQQTDNEYDEDSGGNVFDNTSKFRETLSIWNRLGMQMGKNPNRLRTWHYFETSEQFRENNLSQSGFPDSNK